MGLDKSELPRTPAGDDPGWMGTLIANSNLRFTGAYVTGPPLAGEPAGNFTPTTRAVERAWMRNLNALLAQGWGFAFFYVGHSVSGGEQARTAAQKTRARGELHGRHLRTVMHASGPRLGGSVVIIDNEDGETDDPEAWETDYYLGLFEAMSRPDPDLRAFRPGLYGRGKTMDAMLAVWPDLFMWDVQVDDTPIAPYDLQVHPIHVDVAAIQDGPPPRPNAPPRQHGVPIRIYPSTHARARDPTFAWPLGRQFRFHKGARAELPMRGSATATALPRWRRIETWDYDCCFVRDPARAIAEPRLAGLGEGLSTRILRGRFALAPQVPPQQRLDQVEPLLPIVRVDPFVVTEPDAPLLLAQVGGRPALYTVLVNGEIAEARVDPQGQWGPGGSLGPPPTPAAALRGLRALGVASHRADDSHLVYVAENNLLHARRRAATGAWGAAVQALAQPRVHPFSDLAVCARGAAEVVTLFIDEQRRLTATSWLGTSRNWPAFQARALEQAPSLLRGTALAAVSPTAADLLVFAIGQDRRLRFAALNERGVWSAITPAGDVAHRLGAHGRLGAFAAGDASVIVCALTDAGRLAVYRFSRGATGWTPAPREVFEPPAAAAALPILAAAGWQDGAGCTLNPFGDIVVGRQSATATFAYCAGLRGGAPVLLRRDLSATGRWEVLP